MDGKESSLDDKHNHNDASSPCGPQHLLAGVTVGSLAAPVIGTASIAEILSAPFLRSCPVTTVPGVYSLHHCLCPQSDGTFYTCQSDMLKNVALRLDLLTSPSSLSVKSFFSQ